MTLTFFHIFSKELQKKKFPVAFLVLRFAILDRGGTEIYIFLNALLWSPSLNGGGLRPFTDLRQTVLLQVIHGLISRQNVPILVQQIMLDFPTLTQHYI